MKCDCAERIGIEINSYKFFIELKEVLRDRSRKVYLRMFRWKNRIISVIVKVTDPLYWYADKWYRCNACGTLWEFRYPDFPAVGEVRKFEDGIYPGPETNL